MNPLTPDSTIPNPLPPPSQPGAVVVRDEEGKIWEIPPECIPNIDELVIEDGKPVDSIYVGKQYHLLTEPLYSSWHPPGEDRDFVALANVGVFHTMGEPALVPDVLLSLGVKVGDTSRKENNSYLMWVIGKPPSVTIEIVSDRYGGEETHKLRSYARIGVAYYVIFDPKEVLSGEVLRVYGLHEGSYRLVAPNWLPTIGLGLTLWPGTHDALEATWLRWCDQTGQVIATGKERADQEHQRAEQERQRVERLIAQLRAAGIEPAP